MHPIVDAFWKGRIKLKKHKEEFFDDYKKPKKACAVGAIWYGLGNAPEATALTYSIAQDYPEFRKWVKPAPCGHDDEGGYVSSILIHLNDDHKDWPDKKLADWLEKSLASGNV